MVIIKRLIYYLATAYLLSACSYMQSASKQSDFVQEQKTNPGQHNLKHIIDSDTYIVYGLVLDDTGKQTDQSLSVAAFSDQFKPHELVDVTHFSSVGTHYVLNLPAGKYDFLVMADKDSNGILDQSEVIGWRQAALGLTVNAAKVLTDFDINLENNIKDVWNIEIPVPERPELVEPFAYPKGAIRRLDDPIFGHELAVLGMYEPAAFLERAPIMFYTLEEYMPYKIPVVFVHGIGGSVRDFTAIIEKMDRERYVPFFYYYPSGSDLDQSAENFYQLFLSGSLFPKVGPSLIIVAHSMGGLVVREALNLRKEVETENTVALLITIASPFGGHPGAASGVKNAPMVLPAWRDVAPNSKFLDGLFRKPLSATIPHQLLYAYANPDTLKLGENSDGVVPLHSQLHPVAQKQSSMNVGFNSNHTSILKDKSAIEHIINALQTVPGFYPEAHVRAMQLGGYDVELSDDYNNQEKYVINVMGKYLAALMRGELVPCTLFQQHFIQVSQGRADAAHFSETAWLKFVAEYPHLLDLQ